MLSLRCSGIVAPTHRDGDSGVPPFFVPGAMRDLVVLLGFDCCLAELRP